MAVRSYGQYCAVAKALDVIGDRWTLLIVRELLLSGPSRYTDLRHSLPGVATNLLSERLRELERAGVVARIEAPPPVASTLYSLTGRGEALRPVIHELGLWGVPYMAEGPASGDVFRAHWLAWPVEVFLRDGQPERGAESLAVETADGTLAVHVQDGVVTARPGPLDDADARLSGPPDGVLAVLTGTLSPQAAAERGVSLAGDRGVLERLVRPRASSGVLSS